MKIRLLCSALIFLLLSGCSIFQTEIKSEKKALEYNLTLWDSFHMDGIVEVSYQAFSLRKNFAINKEGNTFDLTVFNSGLMGLNPKPLLKVEYADSLIIDASGLAVFSESIPGRLSIDELPFDLSISKYLLPKSDEIILNKKVVYEEVELIFNDLMQLSKINLDKDVGFSIEYDLHRMPSKIFAVYKDKKLVTFEIDNFKKR